MNHHVRPQLQGTAEKGRGQGVVHHQGQAVFMGQPGQGGDIRHVQGGVADGLHKDKPGSLVDGRRQGGRVSQVHHPGRQPVFGKNTGEQGVGGHEQGAAGHELIAGTQQSQAGIGHGRHTGGGDNGPGAALQEAELLLQGAVGGIAQPGVNIVAAPAGKSPAEALRGLVPKGRRLKDRRLGGPLPLFGMLGRVNDLGRKPPGVVWVCHGFCPPRSGSYRPRQRTA